MSSLFLTVLDMSITAAVIILIVLLLRVLLRRMPKRYFCILWAVAALRLVIPFSLLQVTGAMLSNAETEPADVIVVSGAAAEQPQSPGNNGTVLSEQNAAPDEDTSPADEGITADESTSAYIPGRTSEHLDEKLDPADSPAALPSENRAETKEQSVLTLSLGQEVWSIISFVWLAGVLLLNSYAAVAYLRLRIIVRDSVREFDNIYTNENLSTPFILGIIRPGIYLPQSLTEQEREMILAHERSHLSHLDYLLKPLAFLILSLHWFNPAVWPGYFCFCRDIEIACDERVIAEIGADKKKTYASVLLQCSMPERLSLITPAAFGETAVKERIREILRYRKPSAAVVTLCVVLILSMTAAACMMQSPVGIEESSTAFSGDNGQAKELTEHERHLIELQNEMYEPPVSAGYKTESVIQRPSDRVIYEVIDSLTELCYVNTDTEKQMQIYDETFRKRENDSLYREIIDALLFTSDKNFGDKNDLKRYKIGLFTNKIDAIIPKIKETHPDADEKQLIRLSIEQCLQEKAHRYEMWGVWYGYLEGVLLGQIDVDGPRITLPQVLDIIDRSYQQTGDRSKYIYDQLCLLQKYPDVDLIGSGVYGGTTFYLAGQGESLELIKDYQGYSSIIFTKLYADGTRDMENLYNGPQNGYMYVPRDEPIELSYFTDEPASEESTAPSPMNPEKPSPEAVALLKNTGSYADSIADTIRSRYPSVTQEQMDEILILYDLAAPYDISYAYQVSVAAGKTDLPSPKLTLGDIKRIISEASDIPDGAKDNSLPVKVGIYDILKGIYDIQYYPDCISGDTYEYWPDSNSRRSRTEEIVVEVYTEKVIYNRYDTKGKLISTETLFEAE